MTYSKDIGEVSAAFHPVSKVRSLTSKAGTVMRFVAPGSATEGRYGLFEWNMPAQAGGASPHFHKTFSEAFYVVSGTVGLYDGDSWVDATPGDFLYVPEGGVHGFRNDKDEPAKMLILFSPGAPREKYFEELVEVSLSGRTLSEEEWRELWARHDQFPA
ncbi:cupin domain-containing protein [Nonomuraea sp. NPDC050536]|uniref:cupin domain-containing protein n=1 Tax=Nonomuraea sp. NPDC050536 TaxID=3364366 RepID=UPI0037C9E96D